MATEKFDKDLLAADGDFYVTINRTGFYRVQVGDKQSQAFGSGNITVKQEGAIFDNFNAVTTVVARLLYLSKGTLDIVLAGSTSPDLRVRVEPPSRNS